MDLRDPRAVREFASKHNSYEDFSSVAALAGKLLSSGTQMHVWHWQVKNEAAHTALGELYGSLAGFADSIVEKYMSSGPVVTNIETYPPKNFTDMNQIQSYLDECIGFVEDHKMMCDRADIKNILDELVAEFHQYKYKFTLS